MTDTKVIPFSYQDHPVRSVFINGQPFFSGKDVCEVLGIKSYRDSLSRLDDDERRESVLATPSGNQRMVVINESGLYHLIFRSRKPEAQRFRRWVTNEVLPALRRSGSYAIGGPSASSGQMALPFLDNEFYMDNVKREMLKVALSVSKGSRVARFIRLIEPVVFNLKQGGQ